MSGQLVTILGVMGSGKTEKLIDTYENCIDHGITVSVFKPSSDTRTSIDIVKSRSGRTAPATPISSVESIVDLYGGDQNQVILIDEIQFFDELGLVDELIYLCMQGIDVYCFGLDLTSEGKTFGLVGDIMAQSDQVIKIESKCTRCDSIARISSYRGSDKDSVVKVGDLDMYEPLCRECFFQKELDEITENDLVDVGGDKLRLFEIGNEEMGFKMELVVKESTMEEAGYTYEDILDISTVEGANNLLADLGFMESGEDGDK